MIRSRRPKGFILVTVDDQPKYLAVDGISSVGVGPSDPYLNKRDGDDDDKKPEDLVTWIEYSGGEVVAKETVAEVMEMIAEQLNDEQKSGK